MKILVAGGAGFIGSNFCQDIALNTNYKLYIIDKLTYAGNIRNLELIPKKKYKFYKTDICDYRKISQIFKKNKFDIIVNFAAETHVDRSILNPGDFVLTDVYGTYSLLEAAKTTGAGLFIHMSTDEVYGSLKKSSADENYPLNPTNPYSASKSGADRLCYSYYHTYKMPVIIVRGSNNYGPYQHPEKFIPLFITNALESNPLPLYGSGKNIRNWIFVKDTVAGIKLLIEKGKIGEVYNLGGKEKKQNIFVAKQICNFLKINKNNIKYVKDRKGHDLRYSIDSNKIKKLGWKEEYSFNSGLKETIRWYNENQSWWKEIKQNQNFKKFYKKNYK